MQSNSGDMHASRGDCQYFDTIDPQFTVPET